MVQVSGFFEDDPVNVSTTDMNNMTNEDLREVLNKVFKPAQRLTYMMLRVVYLLIPQSQEIINEMDNNLADYFEAYYKNNHGHENWGVDCTTLKSIQNIYFKEHEGKIDHLKKSIGDAVGCSEQDREIAKLNNQLEANKIRLASARIMAACAAQKKNQQQNFGRVKRRKTTMKKNTTKNKKTTKKRKS